MIHARTDYDPIQDPRPNGIGKDEPVMLFRAQDRLMEFVLLHYISLLKKANADTAMVHAVYEHIQRVNDWQSTHPTKTPDMPYFTGR